MSFSQHLRQLGQPIAYYPQLAKPLGGVTAAIFFGQIFFWQDKTTNPLGVYKTQAEIELETGLSRREQETARKKLVERGILIETHKRLEHRIYFKLDLAKFDALMADIGDCTNPPTPNGGNGQPPMAESAIREVANPPFVNTEITTENTTEITSEKNIKKIGKLAVFEPHFENFWQAGLPKINKAKALKCFKAAFERQTQDARPEDFAKRLAHDVKTRLRLRQFGFDKLHPTTYLNNERWFDDYTHGDEGNRPNPHGDFDKRDYGEQQMPDWMED